MAHTPSSTTIDLARHAVASIGGIPASDIAHYLTVSFGTDGTVTVHTSLCCARHALWLAANVQFTSDECEIPRR